MTDTEIRSLSERYPFSVEELQLLVRCHEHLQASSSQADDFLMILEKASPYQHFFLPGDEETTRLQWVQAHVLPVDLSRKLFEAITRESFVDYANQGLNQDLERFVEGIANTGRRGTREALRILYLMNGLETIQSREVVDMCLRLAVACEAMTEPNLDQDAVKKQIDSLGPAVDLIAKSMDAARLNEDTDDGGDTLSVTTFVNWAEARFPLLVTALSTFVHNLLFHEHKYPEGRIKYMAPKLENPSDVFDDDFEPALTVLSFLSHHFGGTWNQIYSLDKDGQSFNRLEWALLGYAGPTLVIIKTTDGAVVGGFTATPWKESKSFYGNQESFLFRFKPDLAIFAPTEGLNLDIVPPKGAKNFMYLHTREGSMHGHQKCLNAHGLGFGGTIDHPRLFIAESLEKCTAGSLDKAFEVGNILPEEALEQFEILDLEVWGVGGRDVIAKALRLRSDYRQRTTSLIEGARTVRDKRQFAKDMSSGLVYDSKTFAHQEQVRGRAAFEVDDVHGGYKLDHEDD